MVFWSSSIKIKGSITATGLSTPTNTTTDNSIIRTVAMMPPEKFDNISPCARFFPGMKMLFSDNDAPWPVL